MPGFARFDFHVNIDKLGKEKNKYLAFLEYAFMERIRCNKITVLLLTGDTSEGKSSISQKLVEEFCAMEGINYIDFVDNVTIYTPLEYPKKTKDMLFSKDLKKLKYLIIDEGRLVVRAKNWHSFINQVIADIFAMQRRVKRMFVIINTQSLDDIDKDLRRRLTFWGIVYRPLHEKPKLYLYRFWDDTRDPNNIKLRKRGFKGLETVNGKMRVVQPPYISFSMPSKEVWNKYDSHSYTAKAEILKEKLNALMERMQLESGVVGERLKYLVDFYADPKKREELLMHGKVNRKGVYKLRKEAIELFQLVPESAKIFNEKITDVFIKEAKKQSEGDLIGFSEEEQK